MDNKEQRPVVLAVDDTPQNLDVVKGILTPEYRIKVATNGPAALRIVEKQLPGYYSPGYHDARHERA